MPDTEPDIEHMLDAELDLERIAKALAILAAVLCEMTWWTSLDRLSAEERLLVGTWTFEGKSDTGGLRWVCRQTRYGYCNCIQLPSV
jgi:hypothetical protein